MYDGICRVVYVTGSLISRRGRELREWEREEEKERDGEGGGRKREKRREEGRER